MVLALAIKVRSTDKDGSETFTVTIKDIPNGSGLYVYDKSSCKLQTSRSVSNNGTSGLSMVKLLLVIKVEILV